MLIIYLLSDTGNTRNSFKMNFIFFKNHKVATNDK